METVLGPGLGLLTEPTRQLIEVISIETPAGIKLLLCAQPGTAEVLDKLRDRDCFFTGHEVSSLGWPVDAGDTLRRHICYSEPRVTTSRLTGGWAERHR